jgi:hypothetical protein
MSHPKFNLWGDSCFLTRGFWRNVDERYPDTYTVDKLFTEEDVMVYGVITVRTIPGKRFEGIEKLKKLAGWMDEKYETRTQVLGNGTGPIYQNHVVTRYESLAQMEEIQMKMPGESEFMDWFKEAEGFLNWETSSSSFYTVFD